MPSAKAVDPTKPGLPHLAGTKSLRRAISFDKIGTFAGGHPSLYNSAVKLGSWRTGHAKCHLPGGRLAVAVCDSVDNSPGYSAFAQMLDRLFGREVGGAFRAPFVLGDAGQLQNICHEAGIANAKIARRQGKVRFASIDALVSTERGCAWTLGGLLSDEQFVQLLKDSQTTLQPFVIEGGAIEFDIPALIVTAQKARKPVSA